MNYEEYKAARAEGVETYKRADDNGLTQKDRWSSGQDHHLKSEELMAFLSEHDLSDYGDYFCWKVGGDGDNGETLMYEMDAYFEQKDLDNIKTIEK